MGRCTTPKRRKEVVAEHRLVNALALRFASSLKSVEEAS